MFNCQASLGIIHFEIDFFFTRLEQAKKQLKGKIK